MPNVYFVKNCFAGGPHKNRIQIGEMPFRCPKIAQNSYSLDLTRPI